MKDNELDNLLEALQRAPFSDEERAKVRSRLLAYMREHPARAPFFLRFLDAVSAATWHISRALAPKRRGVQFALATLALVLVAGGGTSYAAASALPGEPLYGMKVNIEEPIQGAFALSPQAKANWDATLAARRLSEAEALAAKHELTPAAQSTIASGFDQATVGFDQSVAAVAASSSNPATVADLELTMEATLAAHTEVLNELSIAVPGARPSIAPILSRAQARATAAKEARTQLDATALASVADVKAAAQAQLESAQGQLGAVHALLGVSGTSSATTSPAVEVEQAIQAGQENFARGDYGAAFAALQNASLKAQETQLQVSITNQLQQAGVRLGAGATTSSAFHIAAASAATTSTEDASSTATSTGATSTATTTEDTEASSTTATSSTATTSPHEQKAHLLPFGL